MARGTLGQVMQTLPHASRTEDFAISLMYKSLADFAVQESNYMLAFSYRKKGIQFDLWCAMAQLKPEQWQQEAHGSLAPLAAASHETASSTPTALQMNVQAHSMHTEMCMHVCKLAQNGVCLYVCAYFLDVCMHVCRCVCVCAYMHVRMCVHTCVRAYVCIYLCNGFNGVCVYIYVDDARYMHTNTARMSMYVCVVHR